MATRGWDNITAKDLQRMHAAPVGVKPAKASKYRNVKVVVDSHSFDSKREAGEYLKLKARELTGDISELRLQVRFPLYAPMSMSTHPPSGTGPQLAAAQILGVVQVAEYVSDFTFLDRDGRTHVVDAKGKRTAMYALKAKWLNLQSGIVIEEV